MIGAAEVGDLVALCVMVSLFIRGWLLLQYADRKLRARGCLWVSAGELVLTVRTLLAGNTVMASVYAGFVAVLLWMWWNNGGGDGMKKLLKKASGYLGFGPQAAPSVT